MKQPVTELAARLEALRRQLRCSQNELARRIGIDQGTMSNLINAKKRPRPETIDAIADFTGWKSGDIFDWSTMIHVMGYDASDPQAKAINRLTSENAASLRQARSRRRKG
jgi:transcriptional regulator with XRE-family HTH domain